MKNVFTWNVELCLTSLDFNRCRDKKVLEQLRYVGVTRAKKALAYMPMRGKKKQRKAWTQAK